MNIILTTDLSDESIQAFTHARKQIELYGEKNTQLTLLCVLESLFQTHAYLAMEVMPIDPKKLEDEAKQAAEKRLRELVSKHFSGLKAEPVILAAKRGVADEISAYAKSKAADLIIMATHGRTGLKHVLLGSVTERVIRQTPCPLLVVPIGRD